MNKVTRKLIPAIFMLVIALVFSSTASYAWFSMNKTVTVKGMTVKTVVGSNLLISADTLDSNAKNTDDTFKTTMSVDTTPVTQLEPVSTVDGTSFFYTVNAHANGDALSDEYAEYSTLDTSTFNSAYGLTAGTAVGYVDYVFQLKAVNAETTEKVVALDKLNLIYAGKTDASKAYRVAIFVENITGAAPVGGTGEFQKIYKISDATEQTIGMAVSAEGTAPTAITSDIGTPTMTVAGNSTAYYKVVVRLYIEGEDTTCTNATFLSLTNNWTLELSLTLGGTSVDNITRYTTATDASNTYYFDGTNYFMNEVGGDPLVDTTAAQAAFAG